MTWYDTGNAAFDSTSMNTTIYPKNIARVLPDGTVWYEQNQYNLWGHRTQVTSTYTLRLWRGSSRQVVCRPSLPRTSTTCTRRQAV